MFLWRGKRATLQYNLIASEKGFESTFVPLFILTAGVELFPPVSSLENSSLSVQRVPFIPGDDQRSRPATKRDAPRIVISVRGVALGDFTA